MPDPERPRRYILDETGEPWPEPDLLTWARWYEGANRTLACDDFDQGRVWVSTIFTGLDLNLRGLGEPLLWETMVFGLGRGLSLRGPWRYTTRAAAHAGHRHVLRAVRQALELDPIPAAARRPKPQHRDQQQQPQGQQEQDDREP